MDEKDKGNSKVFYSYRNYYTRTNYINLDGEITCFFGVGMKIFSF